MVTADEVLEFWFGSNEAERAKRRPLWFMRNEEFDAQIRSRFTQALEAAKRGELDGWKQTPRGRLALVILLDQMSRNAFRGTRRAFEQDAQALALVREGLAQGVDKGLDTDEVSFFYLPLEHSESLADQRESVSRYEELHRRTPESQQKQTAETLDYARRHLVIIERFGRFPHRNEILGRPSTDEEQRFLREPNSSF